MPALNSSWPHCSFAFHPSFVCVHRSFDQRADSSCRKSLLPGPLPASDGVAQLLFEFHKRLNLFAHVVQVTFSDGNHVCAGTLSASAASNDVSDFVEREAKRFRLANKLEALKFFGAVLPVTGGGSARLGQELAPLVKADRLNIHLGLLRQFADLHHSYFKPYTQI